MLHLLIRRWFRHLRPRNLDKLKQQLSNNPTNPLSQPIRAPTISYKQNISDRQLSSRILKCFRAEQLFKVCKNKPLNSIHKSLIFCKLVGLGKDKQEFPSPELLKITRGLEYNVEKMNPESLLQVLRVSVGLGEEFGGLQERIVSVFREDGAVELIDNQLAVGLAVVLSEMQAAGEGDDKELKQLAKTCIQRGLVELKKINTLSLVKVYKVLLNFRIFNKNIVKPLIQQSMRRKTYIQPSHFLRMLQLLLQCRFTQPSNPQYNLIHRVISHISSVCKTLSVPQLLQLDSLADRSRSHLSQTEYIYVKEMVVDNAFEKYTLRMEQATDENQVRMPELLELMRVVRRQHRGSFVGERTRRFVDRCIRNIAVFDVEGKLVMFWYVNVEGKSFRVDWQEVFKDTKPGFDLKYVNPIFQMSQCELFLKLFKVEGPFHNHVLFAFKSFYTNINKYSISEVLQYSKKLAKLSMQVDDLISKICQLTIKGIRFVVNLPQWIINILVKERDLFMGDELLRGKKFHQEKDSQIQEVVQILGGKIDGMIKIMISSLIIEAERKQQNPKFIADVQHYLQFGLSQIAFDSVLTTQDIQNLNAISIFTKKPVISNSKSYDKFSLQRLQNLKKQTVNNKEKIEQIQKKFEHSKIGEVLNEVYVDLYLPQTKQAYLIRKPSVLEQTLLNKSGIDRILKIQPKYKQKSEESPKPTPKPQQHSPNEPPKSPEVNPSI